MKAGFSLGFAALVSVAAFSVSDFASAAESVLYSFPSDSEVVGQVQEDSSGNLYGTTLAEQQYGTAYRLQQHQGVWRAKNIHVFNGSDGANPHAGLTLNRTVGAFYGVAEFGGSYGDGVIFWLSQTGHRWTESTLHTFTGPDGQYPCRVAHQRQGNGYSVRHSLRGRECRLRHRFPTQSDQRAVQCSVHLSGR